MQAHAIRLDDAWVTPTWIGFYFRCSERQRLERRLGSLDLVRSLTEKEKNVITILYFSAISSADPDAL